MSKTTTYECILDTGVKLWPDFTLQAVANKTGVSKQVVGYHFTIKELKDATAIHAVHLGDSRVIVQLIASDHPAVSNLSPSERTKHLGRI